MSRLWFWMIHHGFYYAIHTDVKRLCVMQGECQDLLFEEIMSSQVSVIKKECPLPPKLKISVKNSWNIILMEVYRNISGGSPDGSCFLNSVIRREILRVNSTKLP